MVNSIEIDGLTAYALKLKETAGPEISMAAWWSWHRDSF
jgi:hypothetical protein